MSRMSMAVFAVLLGVCSLVQAGDKSAPTKETFLGLKVESVPAALHSQLPAVLAKGQGLLIDEVMKDSPAEKSGLHPNDILVSFGDQKLSSAEQLVKLVRHEKPGKEIGLGLIRAGKAMTSKVTLGETKSSPRQDSSRIFRFTPDERMREMFRDFESKTDGSSWQSFDALKLTRTDETHSRTGDRIPRYRRQEDARVFTGTREEIRKDIMAAKDLPANERAHLLRALNLQEPVFNFIFQPVGDQTFQTVWIGRDELDHYPPCFSARREDLGRQASLSLA